MSKVTITASAEGNAGASIPARAQKTRAVAETPAQLKPYQPSAAKVAQFRQTLADAVLIATTHPSEEVQSSALDALLRTPSFGASARYQKFKVIADAIWPNVELANEQVASWVADDTLPMEKRLIASLLLELATDAALADERTAWARWGWNAAKDAFETATDKMNSAGERLAEAEAAIAEEISAAGDHADAGAIHERHHYKSLEAQWNEALQARDRALDAMLRAPAPDATALIDKTWHAAVDRTGSELEDFNLKTLGELAESDDAETSIPAILCQDLIRLGGGDPDWFDSIIGREAIRKAWTEARAAANPEVLAAE